jgi:O-methyltransferase involved in polyketide biosynthesis
VESRRKDSLLVDSLAKDLVGDDVAQECWRRMVDAVWVPSFIMSKEKYGQMEHDHFVVRHRYIDDFALRHLGAYVARPGPPSFDPPTPRHP